MFFGCTKFSASTKSKPLVGPFQIDRGTRTTKQGLDLVKARRVVQLNLSKTMEKPRKPFHRNNYVKPFKHNNTWECSRISIEFPAHKFLQTIYTCCCCCCGGGGGGGGYGGGDGGGGGGCRYGCPYGVSLWLS